MRSARTQHRVRRGFTLVEVVVSLVVIAVISTVSSGLILSVSRFSIDAHYRALLHEQASLALTRMSTELRAVQVLTVSPSITLDISAVTASSITWNGGANSLSLSGSTIMLVENGAAAVPLLDGVSAFSVKCYDESNAALAATLNSTTSASVRRIALSISVTGNGLTETLSTRVFLRNTMAGGGV